MGLLANEVHGVQVLSGATDIVSLLNDLSSYSGLQTINQIKALTTADYQDLLLKLQNFRISRLGSIVLEHATIKWKSPNKNVGQMVSQKLIYDLPDIDLFLDCVFIDVERRKSISQKLIPNMKYTVDQIISNGNYTIVLSGKFVGYNQYQTDVSSLSKLLTLYEKPKVTIESIYLNTIFGIQEVIIDDIKIDQSKEYTNVVDYTINCHTFSDFNFVTASTIDNTVVYGEVTDPDLIQQMLKLKQQTI